MEDAIERQSDYELSGQGSEEIDRWLDDLDEERLDDAAEDGMENDDGRDDSEEPGEGAAKRQRVTGDRPERPAWLPEGMPTRLRGGPPRNPGGSPVIEPPPGYGEDGQPLPGHGPDGLPVEEWTTVRRKRRRPKKKREGRAIPMPRPVEMTRAEMEQHRREGHANYHPGCAHCVKSRAIADQHRRTEGSGREEEDDGRLPTIAADLCFLGSQSDEDKLTVLAMIDGKSGTLFGIPSPDKAIVNG